MCAFFSPGIRQAGAVKGLNSTRTRILFYVHRNTRVRNPTVKLKAWTYIQYIQVHDLRVPITQGDIIIKIILYHTRSTCVLFIFVFFTNLSLMANTATLHTSNKNTNNCVQIKCVLKTKQKNYYCLKLRNIQIQQSKTDANLNFQGRERDKIILYYTRIKI